MCKNIYFLLFFFISFLNITSCTPDENGDTTAPILTSSTPATNAVDVDINTTITLQFSEKIVLSSKGQIKLNDQNVQATVDGQTVSIAANLQPGVTYILVIPDNAISDVSANYVATTTIRFTTAPEIIVAGIYEAEKAAFTEDAAIATTIKGYTGTGYVNTNAGNVTFTVQTEQEGYYDISMRYYSTASKQNDLYVDGLKMTSLTFNTVTSWTTLSVGKLKLTAGSHTVAIVKNWGWIQLDNLLVNFAGSTLEPFDIAASLVTPNPSAQAVNLYNFLKTNFGTNIISGTMAKHSTNIDEATWVYNTTGKYPAMTFFDFIDHTWLNQNWVKYSAPYTLGQDWWKNNGVLGFTWHWRDPLTKSGSFYVPSAATSPDSGTTFDINKITDTNSAEYKAIIVDIDEIAKYLQQFKDANIPVIWRPLHEAQGGWFWWGAKGAAPCKALWKIMFDRLVNVHGLNNLIWVWTSQADDAATNWYPGDAYVDIIGMDIYPGANQHGSQYLSFNKIKSLFGGKKIITLSECGSAPDPALMLEYGDTWSWFMPWNGDYTESDAHNGATWWKKFFSYDFVITRDKMPSLK